MIMKYLIKALYQCNISSKKLLYQNNAVSKNYCIIEFVQPQVPEELHFFFKASLTSLIKLSIIMLISMFGMKLEY